MVGVCIAVVVTGILVYKCRVVDIVDNQVKIAVVVQVRIGGTVREGRCCNAPVF